MQESRINTEDRRQRTEKRRYPRHFPDALASADINHLLQRAAESVSAALSADHVLVLELSAANTDSRYSARIGWDQTTSTRLGTTLDEWSRQPGLAELERIPPGAVQTPGEVYIPNSAFLQQQGLSAGLFATTPCGDGRLAVLAGSSAADSVLGKTDAQFLNEIMAVMGLTIEQAHAELVRLHNQQQVVQAKHQWESTLDAMPQLMCLIDGNGRVLRANRTLETWNLGEVTSIRETEVHDMLHPGCNDPGCMLKTRWEEMWQQFTSTEFVECDYQDDSMGRDLHCFLYRSGKSHYRDCAEEEGYALLIIEDITRQRQRDRILLDYNRELENLLQERTLQLKLANARLEEEAEDHQRDKEMLSESEKKYTCLMESSLTGFYVIQDDRIVFCNSRFAEIFGFTQEEIYRLDPLRLFPTVAPKDKRFPTGDMEGMSEYQIMRGVTKDGDTIWLNRSLAQIDCLREVMVLGNIIDITVQIEAEIALECTQCDIKVLSEKLLIAQELERKQIAAELHDSIGQSISAIKFGLENALREYGDTFPEPVRGSLTGAVDKLRNTIDEVRKISMDLRPLMLDDLGLLATISWFCREFKALFPELDLDVRTGIEESEIPDSLRVVIFRILQEALNNIGKHAMATRVAIELTRKGDRVSFKIKDDGQGFRSEDLSIGQGYGLGSMRERAELSGGNLVIESAPGSGTLVRADWPAGP